MPRRTTTAFGLPAFVADPNSLAYYGAGAQIDWSTVSAPVAPETVKRLPGGTLMQLNAAGKMIPHDGTATSPAFILQSGAAETSRTDALSGYGFFTGGNFYEALLPNAAGTPRVLTANQKTALGARFFMQLYSDVR